MSFTAKYRTKCAECEDPINPGEEAEYDTDGDVVHVFCPEDASATNRTQRPVCPDCWQELPANGICGVCDV